MPILSFPLNCWAGLAVGNAEVTQPSYVREPLTLDYCADGLTLANEHAIPWPTAKETWGTIDFVQLWDAQTGGNLLVSLIAAAPLLVPLYGQARIPPAGLVCVYHVVNRPYGRYGYGTLGYGTQERKFTETGSGIRPFGTGLWGTGLYAAITASVVLELAFEVQETCRPGTWTIVQLPLAA